MRGRGSVTGEGEEEAGLFRGSSFLATGGLLREVDPEQGFSFLVMGGRPIPRKDSHS